MCDTREFSVDSAIDLQIFNVFLGFIQRMMETVLFGKLILSRLFNHTEAQCCPVQVKHATCL